MSTPCNEPPPWETLPKWPRRAITCWLLFHLLAIISAPASVAPASDLARAGWNVCRPYLQALYLNHGYHFFAPDPGESTLLSFAVHQADGTRIAGQIPHRSIQPRLLYHRHFMLTESLGYIASLSDRQLARVEQPVASEQRPEVADPVSEGAAGSDRESPPPRGLLRDWYQSYARCLLNQYDGQQVELTRVVHFLPEIEWMQESLALGNPLTLQEPQSYREFPVGTFGWEARRLDDSTRRVEMVRVTPEADTARNSGLVLIPLTEGGQP